MPQFYGASGIGEYDEITNSIGASSFGIDIDPNTAITLVTAEWAHSSESSNFNTRVSLRDSGNSVQSVSFRTWTNSTTSTFASGNNSQTSLNYWNLGAANNSSYTGEHMRTMAWIYNDGTSTLPYQHATVYGRTSWEGNNGATNDAMYTIKCRTNAKISSLLFVPQAQSFSWFRANSWSMADT